MYIASVEGFWSLSKMYIRNILEENSEIFEVLTILELQNLAHSLKLDYEDGLREYDLRQKTGLSFPTDWTELLNKEN